MKIETAIALLGSEEKMQSVLQDGEFLVMGDPTLDFPCFAFNQEETIQFRMQNNRIQAVILAPSEVDDYDNFPNTIAELGFRFEKKLPIHLQSGVIERDCFVRESVRIQIPPATPKRNGFANAITVELIVEEDSGSEESPVDDNPPISFTALSDLFRHLDEKSATGYPCDHTFSITEHFLQQRRLPVEPMILWLGYNGAGCDCEVILNTAPLWEEIIAKHKGTRKSWWRFW